MTKVVILGASGMLGHAVAAELRESNLALTLTSRAKSSALLPDFGRHFAFDALEGELQDLDLGLNPGDYIVNCIGVIKPHIRDDNEAERKAALLVNGLFPHRLSEYATGVGAHVIQIATDCVYSGEVGGYDEASHHDALDVYGKTKSLGEVPSPAIMHIRASTIGPEQGRSTLLLEWVLNQPRGAEVTGYTNHHWNGVTTKAFARVVKGIVLQGGFRPGVAHLVPQGRLTKHELVMGIAAAFGRDDSVVTPGAATKAVDRTQATNHPEFNESLWLQAGYTHVPTIAQLLAEIAG